MFKILVVENKNRTEKCSGRESSTFYPCTISMWNNFNLN